MVMFDGTSDWIGWLIGLVGIAVAVVTYLLARSRMNISYQSSGLRLIGGDAALPKSVKVEYDGKSVPRLTRTTVAFWNSGNVTIDGAAVVKANPCQIDVGEDAEVLAVEVERSTREVIGVTADVDSQALGLVNVGFEFLDPLDGAVISILHSGKKSFGVIVGTIKGLPRGFRFAGSFERKKRRRRILGVALPPIEAVLVMVMTAAALHAMYQSFHGGEGPSPSLQVVHWIAAWIHLPKQVVADEFVGGCLLLIMIITAYLWLRPRYAPSSLSAEPSVSMGPGEAAPDERSE